MQPNSPPDFLVFTGNANPALAAEIAGTLGISLGALKAALLASLLYMVLASTLSATNAVLSRSLTAPYLRQGAQLLQALINDPKLRAYFTENTPAIPLELMEPKNQQAAPEPAKAPPPPAPAP